MTQEMIDLVASQPHIARLVGEETPKIRRHLRRVLGYEKERHLSDADFQRGWELTIERGLKLPRQKL